MDDFDDGPQWYWASCSHRGPLPGLPAGRRFVVARGQRELWCRVRSEVDPGEGCAWMAFGPADGVVPLVDCFHVFVLGRERYGADLNRVLLELAQIRSFAQFLRDTPKGLHQQVFNPMSLEPLAREPYDPAVVRSLGSAVARTLAIRDLWWEG